MTATPQPVATARVDLVRLRDQAGERELSLDEFLRIPLRLRVRYLLNQDVRFFTAGRELAASVALGSLLHAS